jgi:ribose/xylose/arabinose/galactoside ABC-type transport system permease subunit
MAAAASRAGSGWSWRSVLLWPALPSLLLFAIAFGIDASLSPNLVSTNGMIGFASSNLPLILASVGQAFLLIGRTIDLSIGASISLLNVSAVALFEAGVPIPAVIALIALEGVAIGAVNAGLVVYLRINPLLATFATSFVAGGAALWLRPAPGGAIPIDLVMWMMGQNAGLPNALALVFLTVVAILVLKRTAFMLRLYAVGGSDAKSFASGIHVERVRTAGYLLAGFFTGMAGLALTFAIGSSDPLIGESYTLQSIAAPVIGGVAILGGSGDPIGAIFGALFLVVASELLLGFGVNPFYQQFIVGIIILVGLGGVVVLQRVLAGWRARGAIASRRRIVEVA